MGFDGVYGAVCRVLAGRGLLGLTFGVARMEVDKHVAALVAQFLPDNIPKDIPAWSAFMSDAPLQL